MKICFYHPNLHLMGGGETVALTLASYLRAYHDITMYVTRPVDVEVLEKYFDLELDGIQFVVFGKWITQMPSFNTLKNSLYVKCAFKHFDKFDYVIDTCSNGLFHKKSKAKQICYIHFPNFTAPKKGIKSVLNFIIIKKEEMFTYDKIFCNSEFTRQYVSTLTTRPLFLLYPPVIMEKTKVNGKKKNIIVTIGRFSPEKKHEVLIEAFNNMKMKAYQLHIIGASADKNYLAKLRSKAKQNTTIFFHENMPHTNVQQFLAESKIYWHARGFGEKDPVEYENFGITTVEAMTAGCVPIVINLGAQPEIVRHGIDGFCWNSIDELITYTKCALAQQSSLSSNAKKRARKYSSKNFLGGFDFLKSEKSLE